MKKSSRVISTLLLGATLTTLSANVFAVESKETIEKKLLAGNNRYETAVKVSEKWEKADNVVLVNALAMADALAATPLAKLKDAPILLTDAGELTKATKERIEKLGAKNVFVVGGEGVVSKAVVAELEKAGLKVERISGVDRFETSAKVASQLEAKKVAVVNGLNGRLADALSVAAPAAENNMAILLTNGKDLGAVKDAAKDKEAVVVGGSAVVADSIKSDLKAERLGGANRNETNAEVMKKFYGDKQVKSVYVAKDGAAQENQLVDALAAGPVAGKEGAPIVLAGSDLSAGQKKFLEGQGEVATVYEVGGGIKTSTVNDIMKALGVKDVVDKAEVSSVKATNLKEVVVTFGMKVDRDSAEDKTNYSINKDASIDRVELSEDGRTAVIIVEGSLKNQDKYKLTVDKVTAGDKEITAKDYEFTPMDNAYPEVKEVKSLGTKAIKVVFSEPVNKVNSNNFKLDGKTFYGSVTEDGREVILKPYEKDALKPGEYKLNVEGVEDYAKFKSLPSEHKFTVVEDKVAPKVEKVIATLEKVKITFSEDVDPDTVKASNLYYKSGDKKVRADRYRKINGTTYEFYFEGDNRLPGYDMTMYMEDVKDYSDNKITETSFQVKPEVDQERPKVKSVTLSTDKKTVTVKFSKNIHNDSLDAKYFTIKDKDSKVRGIESIKHANSTDKNIVKINLYEELPAGKNTIKIVGVKDNTYLQNVMLDYEGTIDAADTESPKRDSYSVNKDTRTVVVTFNKKMDVATLANHSNYVLANKAGNTRGIPEDTEITVIQDGKGVRLVFPEYMDKDNKLVFGENYAYRLGYMGVRDEAGNFLAQHSDSILLKDVAAIVAEKYDKDTDKAVKATDRKTIKVKFTQSINKASKSSFELTGTNAEIDEVITNNTNVVTIKLRENLSNTSTDGLGLKLNVKDGKVVDMETSAGSKVEYKWQNGDQKDDGEYPTQAIPEKGLAIDDALAPEVKLEKDQSYSVHPEKKNVIVIPFTEELNHDKNVAKDASIEDINKANATLLAQYKTDIVVTRSFGSNKDVEDFTLGFYKDKDGVDYSKLEVTIMPKDNLKASRYVIELRKYNSDNEVRYIQDVPGNAALAKEQTYTAVVSEIDKTENDKEVAKKELKEEIDKANLLHNGATEGTAVGEYAVDSKATLKTAIEAAETAHDAKDATKESLNTAKTNLLKAVKTFEDGKVNS
ncbi:cell wall binding repeat 2 family protein [Clostridium argentinense CDC 2741]|uniref:Cell wall binding repeat 2 family protein n=1 Tax=Clostridium argentinense CDC 2741 TaxID=1418104 RepID=A0A0C1QZM4_9CLOT|nr:cell wall-binding repeat-containing protein [Clostridium argentinense]KIE46557.1 cell wall binding repeat 2 family protein [Clostridium argentinense CDC 2741]